MTGAAPRDRLGPVALVLTAAYPPAVYLLVSRGMLAGVAVVLLAVTVLRLVAPGRLPVPAGLDVIAALGLAVALLFTRSERIAYLYPVAVNAGLLAGFGATLLHPPSMIERIARAMGDELDERGRRYVRHLTMVWCGFFLANGLVALGTALWGSPQAWALYTGLVSYLLAGALLLGERLLRPAWAKP